MKPLKRPIVMALMIAALALPGSQALAQSGPSLPPAFPAGNNPTDVAVDSATHTAYVTNGGDGTVSIVDISRCHAGDTSGCTGSAATVTVGQGPVDAVVNQTTNTVYVTDSADNTVSVIDGATCNAAIQTGCHGTAPTIPVGPGPDSAAVDEATNTLYVLNSNNGNQGSVSIVDGSRCDALTTTGCSATWPTVPVGLNSIALAFDSANRTIYVANCGAGSEGAGCAAAGTLSMIDASTCHAGDTAECPSSPPSVQVPGGAGWVDADAGTDTVYVVGLPEVRAPVSVIDGATCNGRTTAGCAKPQPSVSSGSIPIGLVVDQKTHAVYVTSQEDSAVSAIDGTTCNLQTTRGCGGIAPVTEVGFDPGTAGLDPSTGTLYVPSQNLNNVYVLDVNACSVTHPSGCRHAAPTTTTGDAPQGIAVDSATGTIYAGNRSDNALSVINGAICNGNRLSGCGTAWPTVATDPTPQSIAVDDATHTVYTGNNSGTVSVIDISHCNAADTTGCGRPHATVSIGASPDPIRAVAVDDALHTLYVTDGNGNDLAMIDTMRCNGTVTSGCGTAPATVATGTFPDGLAIDPLTQTVYAANWHSATATVIDAATCNARITTGCAATHPAIPVGQRPNLMAFNPATRTLYVPNADSGTVSVIDTTVCNAHNASGCGKTAASITISSPDAAEGAPSPFAVRLDEARDVLYITDVVDSDVVVIDGATCNGTVTSGCGSPLALIPVGGWPTDAALDPALDAIYVSQNVDAQVSIVRLQHPRPGALGLVTRNGNGSGSGTFTVWFDSPTPGQGEILFGSGPGCSGLVETATGDRGAGTTSHIVQVRGNDLAGTVGNNGILPGTTYWYETATITAAGTTIDNNGGACYSVTVPPM